MNAILSLGKYLFALPFAIFGVFHFMNADVMAGMAFGSSLLVYLTGAALIAAAISILIGKLDKLATVLLALFLILTALLVHLQGYMDTESQSSMSSLLKDLALAGAAMIYAKHASSDSSAIGA
ncbi:MAG: hypothetical protein R3350_01995 [Saprospiraceae bacterium]|nr:hypothetical protein [Saprospiraceae bacterium]